MSTVVGRLGSLDPQGSLVQKSAKKSSTLGLPSPKAAPSRGTAGKPRADGAPTSPAPMALDATKVTLKKLAATSGTVAVVRTRSAVSHQCMRLRVERHLGSAYGRRTDMHWMGLIRCSWRNRCSTPSDKRRSSAPLRLHRMRPLHAWCVNAFCSAVCIEWRVVFPNVGCKVVPWKTGARVHSLHRSCSLGVLNCPLVLLQRFAAYFR